MGTYGGGQVAQGVGLVEGVPASGWGLELDKL